MPTKVSQTNNIDEANDLAKIKAQCHQYPRTAIQLRRAFWKSKEALDINSKLAFYDAVSTCESESFHNLTNMNFFIASLFASQISFSDSRITLPEYLCSVYNKASCSESQKRRIQKLLAIQNKPDGRLLEMMVKFIKYANREGKAIDEYHLYRSLRFWNANYNRVPEQWAKTILYNKQEENEVINDEQD